MALLHASTNGLKKVLVAYDTLDGHTKEVAHFIADTIREEASLHQVNVLHVKEPEVKEALEGCAGSINDLSLHKITMVLPSSGSFAVVFGGPVRFGKHSDALKSFASQNRDILASRPTAFFSTSLAAAGNSDEQQKALKYLEDFIECTSLKPVITSTIAGKVRPLIAYCSQIFLSISYTTLTPFCLRTFKNVHRWFSQDFIFEVQLTSAKADELDS